MPALIVEAPKSVLAMVAAANLAGRKLLVVGCGGCYGWRGTIGKAEDPSGARVDVRGALTDFNLVVWKGREAIILFDARPNIRPTARRPVP